MTDDEIIALLNNRDESAIAALNERFGGLCHSLALNVLEDMRDAEECVSSVYFKLWLGFPQAKPTDLTAYIAKCVRNEALMRCRANSAQKRYAVLVPLVELENCLASTGNAEDELNAKALATAVDEFVARLPAVQRGVFMRRYWFFDSAKDIAARFGITENRVKVLLARTRRQLRSYLKREEYINE